MANETVPMLPPPETMRTETQLRAKIEKLENKLAEKGKELTKEKAEKKKLKKEHEEYVKASEDTFNKYKDTSSRKFEEMNIAFTKLKDEHHSEVLALYKQIAFLHEQPQRKQPRLEAGSSMSF